MLRNYFKVALRGLRKRPGTTLINVGGLGLGLACCFLIVLFLQHELSFDGFHEEGDRIVRLTYTNDGVQFANSAAGFAPLVREAFPEVEHAVRVENYRSPYLRLPDGSVRRLEGFALVDDGFLETFSFPLLRGDAATALDGKYDLVLTEAAATALFGTLDAVGRTVAYGDHTLTVTGVAADPPSNSHLSFGALASFRLLEEFMGTEELTGFTNFNYETFLLLRPGTDAAALGEKVTAAVHARLRPDVEDIGDYGVVLQPLREIYFDTSLAYDSGPHRAPGTLWTFGAIGLLILLIACVNFMNLATARATQRAREVGVRKAIGAQREQLVGQFLGESVLQSALAVGVGVGLAALALPFFNEALGGAARLDVRHVGTALLLDRLRAAWERFAPGYAFEYRFLDDDFDRLYRGEQRLGRLFAFFAGVAVFIACLGLFGLAAYTAERRTKEIGVRKVLGASVPQIVRLLAGEFARLVLIGFAVAAPLAWLGMGRWLDGFAYRVALGPFVFVVAGLLALAIALLTVSSQALRAASADPVKSLRYE